MHDSTIKVDWPEMVSFRDFVSDEVRDYIDDKSVMQSDMLMMELIIQLRRLSENLERSRNT